MLFLNTATCIFDYNNSNGFIKGESFHRAIAQFTNLVIREKLYYVID